VSARVSARASLMSISPLLSSFPFLRIYFFGHE
jgi:hypothetical protein